MAVLLKKRLVNPGKRKMTARQKLFFGTKRQRAAVSKRLSNKSTSKRRHNSSKSRVRNVGEIITLSLPKRKSTLEVIRNPMAVAKRRKSKRARRRNAPLPWSVLYNKEYYGQSTSHRADAASRGRMRRAKRRKNGKATKVSNPKRRRKAISLLSRYRYRNPSRLANPYRRRVYRRFVKRYRNPGFLSSDIAKVAGILGGATLTNLIAKQIPSKYTTGTLGYASLTAIAFGQGYVVKKFLKNQVLGEDMMIGGLVLVAMKLMADFFPSISLPFNLAGGLGLIGNSSFPIPQVPVAGSMGRFLVPPNYQTAINAAIPVAQTRTMNGINQSLTMGGRTGARRVGRIS